ncbi:MAP3K14 [Branchiostoma lanceolatum]|uniref:mitogen-activated protein kinase kinase n=1 Tax=Branchiostoma lanceolatum TaxID=7740 RepID=A0A8J9ZPB7_BRALA|nr:MAP3K14 [Branchiostoma lanceolatum]
MDPEKNSGTEPGSLTHGNKDLHDAPVGSLEGFRPADSGVGPSVVRVSSEVYVRQGDVGQILDLCEASLPTQTQSDQNGIHAARPTSSQWKSQQDDDTNSTLISQLPVGNQQLSLYEQQVDPRPSEPELLPLRSNTLRLSFSCKEDVLEKVLEEWKKQWEGKSEDVVKFYSAVTDFLGKFEQQKDYNLLLLQKGLLISLSEVTKDDTFKSKVMIEQWSREYGTFWLYAKLSEDNTITYRKGINFEMRSELGGGSEGTVYVAYDKEGLGVFAVKRMTLEKFFANKTALSAFLQLAGCEQICSPYGVLLDEKEECVLLLMEKLKGETLKRLFDRGEQIGVRKAVVYAVEIMKALRYINSKELLYTDVKDSNVIIINDGSDAIIIDITGVKSPPSIMQYNIYSQFDMMHAILLLNKMLLEPRKRNSYNVRWKPSDADRDNFDHQILDRLANLVSLNYGPYTVEEPLKELQEILEELPESPSEVQQQVVPYQEEQQDPTTKLGFTPRDLTQPGYSSRQDPDGQQEPKPVEKTSNPRHPHEPDTSSCETLDSDGIPSPLHLTSSSESDSEKGQPAPGGRELNKPIGALKQEQKQTDSLEEEREILKYYKKLKEAEKRIEEQNKMLASTQSLHQKQEEQIELLKAEKEKHQIEMKNLQQDFNRVNKKRIDREEAEKMVQERDKMISELLHENQQLKQMEKEHKNLWGVFETVRESRKELKSKVECLEAEILKRQEREREWKKYIDSSKAAVQIEREKTEKAEKNAEQLRKEIEALKAQRNREVQERARQHANASQTSPRQEYELDKLFVVGLSQGTSQASVRQAFRKFGVVTESIHWTPNLQQLSIVMSEVGDTVVFYISEEDDYSPKAGAQDSDIEDSGTQTLHTVDDKEEGLQFERERNGESSDQPKFAGSKGVEPISIPEMVTKDAPVEEKLEAPPNDTNRLYTIEDILEALKTEDGHSSLKDKQEKKISLRTEESKTVKAMRDACRKRMMEEERRIRKRTWRKYSLDSLNSDKMLAGLSGEEQGLIGLIGEVI